MDGTADGRDGGEPHVDNEVVAPTPEQIAELNRVAEETLQTPIATDTPEGVKLEAARLATLVERERLRLKEQAHEARACNIPAPSRLRRQL